MPLINFGMVNLKLYRCGQPDLKGCRDLASLGITAIIKLNSEDEFPTKLEHEYFGGFIEAKPVSVFFPDRKEVKKVADRIQELIKYGHTVCVHCTHGRDRTGLVIGAWSILYGELSYEKVELDLHTFGIAGLVKLADVEIISCLKDIWMEKEGHPI